MKSRFLALVLVGAFTGAFTGTFTGDTGLASAQPHPGKNKETKIERVKKRVRALRAYTLTEELGLDTDGAAKLFPVLSKYDDEFDRLLTARGGLNKALDAAGDLKDAKAIDKLIDQMIANQRAFWDLEEKRIAELRKILTPAQTARLLVVLPALERKLQNQLRNAAQGAKAANARRMEADADDDDVEPNEKPTPPPRPAPGSNPKANQTGCDPFSSIRCNR